jgi:hypothetical protein
MAVPWCRHGLHAAYKAIGALLISSMDKGLSLLLADCSSLFLGGHAAQSEAFRAAHIDDGRTRPSAAFAYFIRMEPRALEARRAFVRIHMYHSWTRRLSKGS